VPLILFARRIGAMPHAYVVRLLVILGPVLLVAAASWYLIERPMIAWAGKPRDGRRGSRARAGARRDQLEAHAAP
jgi:peptidoglycan/LPS O-acetylase OafA/YrhL